MYMHTRWLMYMYSVVHAYKMVNVHVHVQYIHVLYINYHVNNRLLFNPAPLSFPILFTHFPAAAANSANVIVASSAFS